MQLGLLADIHGNALALQAVLDDARRLGITDFVNLGDILYGPLDPLSTYQLLRNVNVLASIAGNQDRAIFEATSQTRQTSPTLDWVCSQLPAEAIAWLAAMPATASFAFGPPAAQLYLCHGSPASDTEYLLEDISTGHACLRPDAEIAAALQHISEPVLLCGHTHIARLVQLAGGPLVINPGSVGLPAYDDTQPVPHVMESGSPHANWAILDATAAGWHVTFRRVAYPWLAAGAQARALGRPDWAIGIETGRMSLPAAG